MSVFTQTANLLLPILINGAGLGPLKIKMLDLKKGSVGNASVLRSVKDEMPIPAYQSTKHLCPYSMFLFYF